jgi:hypothetical protein
MYNIKITEKILPKRNNWKLNNLKKRKNYYKKIFVESDIK